MKALKFVIFIIQIALILANNNFSIIDNNNLQSTISFNIGDLSFDVIDGYHKIQSEFRLYSQFPL